MSYKRSKAMKVYSTVTLVVPGNKGWSRTEIVESFELSPRPLWNRLYLRLKGIFHA